MKIDLALASYNDSGEVAIDETISLGKEYYEKTDIRDLSDLKVVGKISDEGNSTYALKLNVIGEMILPCSISLVDVKYPFNIEIDEIIDLNVEESEDYLKIIDNTIDIIPIIWQNIVVEIPVKVVSSDLTDVKLEGDGWKLLTEEEKKQELDPRLEKLRDLLDD